MKNRNIQFKPTLGLLIAVLLGCVALSPTAQAQLPPPAPDGGYPGFNTAEGEHALFNLTTGSRNTAVGWHSLSHNTEGSSNTATGTAALLFNTTGFQNTANEAFALFNNTTGFLNTATGYKALFSQTNGAGNTATGDFALYSQTASDDNTATGSQALYSNTTGESNTANGSRALTNNITGDTNTATGSFALASNTTGSDNTAIGTGALIVNTTGSDNTAIGTDALPRNTGSNNIGLGKNAGHNLTTGSGNVCIGQGVLGVAGENNTTRIRNVYPSMASARAVYVNSDNKIGTLMSSRRFKNDIKPMDKVSEAILALKPVTFRYKKEIEPNGAIMFGLIAEEVEQVDAELVTCNDKGEVETVRYEAVNAMLLNEFLKEHSKMEEQGRKIQEQEATITALKSTAAHQQKAMEAVTVRLDQQAAQIQKVNAQLAAASPSGSGLEASKFDKGRIRDGRPAEQMVLNN